MIKYYSRTIRYIYSIAIIYIKNTFSTFHKCLVQLLSCYLKSSRLLTSSNRYVKILSKSRCELFNKSVADNILLRSKVEISHMYLKRKIQIISWPARLPEHRWQRKIHRMVFHHRPFRLSRRIITYKDFPPIRITTITIIPPCR